jgi:hypothetical protein
VLGFSVGFSLDPDPGIIISTNSGILYAVLTGIFIIRLTKSEKGVDSVQKQLDKIR